MKSTNTMAYHSLRQEYMLMPPVTRAYTTVCLLTSIAVQLDVVSPFHLYFNPLLITQKFEIWRLLTPFFFFGTFSFNFLFNMIFTYRYCRMLEEGSFRGRTADFVYMFIFGCITTVICAWFVNLLFLGHSLTTMFVYIWARRNPYVRMNFFGLLPFRAPYLPWVLVAFSVLLGNSVLVDILGIAIGHLYFFLEDVFPNQPGGRRLLATPRLLKLLFDTHIEDPLYNPAPDERPGGFDWGAPGAPGAADAAAEQPRENENQ